MSTTHLVAIRNQVRQRNKCYKQFMKGIMLRKHSNKGMVIGSPMNQPPSLVVFIYVDPMSSSGV